MELIINQFKIRCEFYTIQVRGMQKFSRLENLTILSQRRKARKGKNKRRFTIILSVLRFIIICNRYPITRNFCELCATAGVNLSHQYPVGCNNRRALHHSGLYLYVLIRKFDGYVYTVPTNSDTCSEIIGKHSHV